MRGKSTQNMLSLNSLVENNRLNLLDRNFSVPQIGYFLPQNFVNEKIQQQNVYLFKICLIFSFKIYIYKVLSAFNVNFWHD